MTVSDEARELLAAEYEAAGERRAAKHLRDGTEAYLRPAVVAVTKALSQRASPHDEGDRWRPRDNIDEIRAAIADPGKYGGLRGQLSLPSWQAEAVVNALDDALSHSAPKLDEGVIAEVTRLLRLIVREDDQSAVWCRRVAKNALTLIEGGGE